MCVVNNTFNDVQCAILWHVDDIKVFHVETKVVDKVLYMLDGEFGELEALVVTWEKVHEYLWMKIDNSKKRKVVISMIKYTG